LASPIPATVAVARPTFILPLLTLCLHVGTPPGPTNVFKKPEHCEAISAPPRGLAGHRIESLGPLAYVHRSRRQRRPPWR
jgi:hypothetical protein